MVCPHITVGLDCSDWHGPLLQGAVTSLDFEFVEAGQGGLPVPPGTGNR